MQRWYNKFYQDKKEFYWDKKEWSQRTATERSRWSGMDHSADAVGHEANVTCHARKTIGHLSGHLTGHWTGITTSCSDWTSTCPSCDAMLDRGFPYWAVNSDPAQYAYAYRKGHWVQLQVDSIDPGIVPVCMGLCIWGLEFWRSDNTSSDDQNREWTRTLCCMRRHTQLLDT